VLFFLSFSDGVKPMNGAVNSEKGPSIDSAFTTKRDQYLDFNKTLEASKQNAKAKDNKLPTKDKDNKDSKIPDSEKVETKDNVAILDKDDKSEKSDKEKEGVRYYRIALPPKVKKTGKDKNKVDTTMNVKEKKDSDDLELGAEASNIKSEDKDEKEEEKVIEVFDFWPVIITKR
jgi:hypothetical protein